MVIVIARNCLKTLIRNENKFRAIFLANKKIIDEININSSGGSSRALSRRVGIAFLLLILGMEVALGSFYFPGRLSQYLSVTRGRRGKKRKHEKKIVKFCRRRNLPKYLSRNIIVFVVVALGGASGWE